MVRGDLEGAHGAYIGTYVPCVSSKFDCIIARHGHGDMGSSVWGISAKFSLFLPFQARLGTPYLHGAEDLASKEGRSL